MRAIWYFGDGETSYDLNPKHIYKSAGTYTVSVYVSTDYASWTEFVYGKTGAYGEGIYKGSDLAVNPLDFVGVPLHGKKQLTVQFTLKAIVPGIVTKVDYVHVYDWDYNGGINLSKTDRCLRFALPHKPSQGIGWSVYDGEGWPYPEGGGVGCCEILNSNDERIQLTMDSSTFFTYQLGKYDQWVDAEGEYVIEHEIESEITLREHTAPVGASARLRHSQSHLWLKPWYKDRRNTGEYNADGFRNANSTDIYIKKDSSPDIDRRTKQVPIDGQITFDGDIDSKFLQMGFIITGAPWRFVQTQQWYRQIDVGDSPHNKTMTEMDWQIEWSESYLWFSRSNTPDVNLATGLTATGSYGGLTTGPDNRNQSAVVMALGQSLSTSINDLDGNFTIGMWIKPMGQHKVNLFDFSKGNLTISLEYLTDSYEIFWRDNKSVLVFSLGGDINEWAYIALKRDGSNVVCYKDGQLVNTGALADSTIVYGGSVVMYDAPIIWFDSKIVPRGVSEDAIAYIYRNVTQKNGDAVCPPV